MQDRRGSNAHYEYNHSSSSHEKASSCSKREYESNKLFHIIMHKFWILLGPLPDIVVSQYFAESKANHDDLQEEDIPPPSAKFQKLKVIGHPNFDDLLVFILEDLAIITFGDSTQFLKDL